MARSKRYEIVALKNYFLKHKKKVLLSLVFTFLFFGLAAAFAGLKLFYPYHFFISLFFLILAIRFLIKVFLFDRKKVAGSKIFSVFKDSFIRHKKLLLLILLLLIGAYILWTVIPHSGNPFQGLSRQERKELIETDLEIATVLIDNLELSGNELIQSPLLQKESLNAEESQELRNKWNLFLSVAIESEKVTDIHKYFNRINIFSSPQEH